MIHLSQNFAHAMTAELSRLVQNFSWNVRILYPKINGLVQECSISRQGLKLTLIRRSKFLLLLSKSWSKSYRHSYPNGPEAGREAGWGSEFVPLKKRQAGSFILLHKISRTACCFGIRTFLKQYSCYESATNWYTDHQYLAQYSDIINNLQEIPLIFCNYAVRSCGTWRKGPGQSPCNGLSISDLELYVTETSTGVCDPRHRLKCGTHA